MTKSLVIGVDAGATSTRVSVHALDGTRVGYAKAGPGNPTAHGLAKAVSAITSALDQALAGVDAAQVAASLAGVAGNADELVPELAEVWAARGIPAGPRITGDLPIAYAAGTSSPDGSVLLSGTGADAARFAGFELDVIADGLGWLLGDFGSGFWIGREAARVTVHTLDRGEPTGALGALVIEHFLGPAADLPPRGLADRIVRLAQADHMRLAALSALVSQAFEAGDPATATIVAEAADHLAATLRRVHAGGPVVLAGSVLTSEGPVRHAVQDLLAGYEVRTAGDAAGAAAWLAARELLDEPERAHAAFTL
ncbi:N-acetylglucosamine kinase [Nonomuraea sp. NPDC050536]|uniref:N-acetylglucosamine kinase n=1 Tax=Nonomuraea sp. NPDC050536 TaxID=3364366 RepID=UPI0037C60001